MIEEYKLLQRFNLLQTLTVRPASSGTLSTVVHDVLSSSMYPLHPGPCRVRVFLALVCKFSNYLHLEFKKNSLAADSKHVTEDFLYNRYTLLRFIALSLPSSFYSLSLVSRLLGAGGYAIILELVVQLSYRMRKR